MKRGNLVIKHHGIVILRDNAITLVSDTPYLSVADGGLEGILDNQSITYSYNNNVRYEEDDTQTEWEKVKEAFANFGENFEIITGLMNKLRKVQSKQELENIYEGLFPLLSIDLLEIVDRLHKEQPDLVLSIMTKTLIESYVRSQLKRTTTNKVISLEIRRAKGEALQTVMDDALNLDFSTKAENGIDKVVEKTFNDQLNEHYLAMGSSCWNCSNGYVSCCEKIRDYPTKKDIADYPFITDGFQWYVDGELEKFVITKCKDSRDAPKLSYTSGNVSQSRKAKMALIHMLYRNVDTEEEAREVESRNKVLGYK